MNTSLARDLDRLRPMKKPLEGFHKDLSNGIPASLGSPNHPVSITSEHGPFSSLDGIWGALILIQLKSDAELLLQTCCSRRQGRQLVCRDCCVRVVTRSGSAAIGDFDESHVNSLCCSVAFGMERL
jgi:hypothetical protein